MSVQTSTLSEIELFAELEADELATLAPLFSLVKVTEGEALIRRNAPASTFYVVLSGDFMLVFEGDKAITLHGRGQIIGMSIVFSPLRYKSTGVALTDSEVLAIGGDDLLGLIQENAELGDKLLKQIHHKLSERSAFVREMIEKPSQVPAAS